MVDSITIGMACAAAVVRESDAAENKGKAWFEAVEIEAMANAERGEGC